MSMTNTNQQDSLNAATIAAQALALAAELQSAAHFNERQASDRASSKLDQAISEINLNAKADPLTGNVTRMGMFSQNTQQTETTESAQPSFISFSQE